MSSKADNTLGGSEGPPLLRPGLTIGAPPPFHQLGAYLFQDLCREVVAEEPTISTCNVYGNPGQKQYGIDLIAQREANDGIEVMQCKCYEDFPPAEIIAASDEFLEHWTAVWSHQNVRRFVLIVACSLIHTQRHDEILRQRRRFQDLGVQYEAWSAHDLRTRLSSLPAIVSRFLKPDQYWVREICGPAEPGAHWAAPSGPSLAHGAAADLIAALTATVGREIDHIRGHIREGRYDEAAKWLETGMLPDGLAALPPPLRARILRLRASITLELHEKVDGARQLVDEADRLDPEGVEGARLRAVLVLFESGPKAALEALGHPVDIDGINLRSALLIELGADGEAEQVLARLEADNRANHETFRLRAFVALSSGDRDAAGRFVDKAAELAPQRESVRLMQASVRYSLALYRVEGDEVLPWPRPVEWWQVRRDDESRTSLDEAHAVIKDLLGRFKLRGAHRRILETWALACLANQPERQQEAREFVTSVLEADPGHTRVISWACARSLAIPVACRATLEQRVVERSAEPHHILALLNIYIGADEFEEADRLHTASRDIFERAGAEEVWKRWRVLLLLERGSPDDLRVAMSDYKGPLADALRVMSLGPAERAAQAVEVLGRGGAGDDATPPDRLYELCRAAAADGQWHAVAGWAERLVRIVPTPDAVQLAAVALYQTEAFERCVLLIEKSSPLFPQGRLPVFLRQKVAQSLAALGRLPAATRQAAALSQERPTAANLLAVFELHMRQGDLASCATVARDLAAQPALTFDQCLLLARVVQVQDRPLAAGFWRRSASGSVPDQSVATVVDLGRQVGQPDDLPLLQALHDRLVQLGREGRAGVMFVDTEEQLRSFVDARLASSAETDGFYRRSEAPLHVLLPRFNQGWAAFIQGRAHNNEAAPMFSRRPALYLRHGARPRSIPLGPPAIGERRLNLDITSLLVLDGLGLLDRTIAAFKEARIAQETIPLLVLERTAGHQGSRLGDLIDRLRALVHSDRISVLPVSSSEDQDETDDDDDRGGEDERHGTFGQASAACVTALLAVTPQCNDVLCVDDRFMSRYSSNQGVPVLGLLEVLDALVLERHLNSGERLHALSRLRAWNVRHLALDAEEVLQLLDAAPVANGRLEETVDLRVLRSYVAASLLEEGVLQFPPMPPGSPNPTGEIEYVMSIMRSTHAALLAIFRPERTDAPARARWLLEWLLPDLIVMGHSSGANQPGRNEPDELAVLSLAQLVTLPLTDTITEDLEVGEAGPQRAQYARWLNGVLEDHFSAQPALRRRVWEAVRATLTEVLTHGAGEERPARLASVLMARSFMRALPETLEDLAVRDLDFLARHGLEITRTITLNDVCFRNESFHSAVLDAVNGRPARARLAGSAGGEEVDFAVEMVDGTPELVFTPPGTSEQTASRDPAFGAVSDDASVRARSFEELREALGLSAGAFAEIERQLLADTPAGRMDHYHDLWNRSGEVFYNAFRRRCQRHEEFSYGEMRPGDGAQTLNYFGLSAESWDLDRTAGVLIDRCGLESAILRLSGVPCALPGRVRDAFRSLELTERAGLLARLRGHAQTAMDGIRLLELATVGGLMAHSDHSDLGATVFESLLSDDDGVRQFQALRSLAGWTSSNFLRWADTNDWCPTSTRNPG